MHVGRNTVTRDVKLDKRAMRRLDARIDLVRQPIGLHLTLNSINIPAILAAEVRILETETAFVIRGRYRSKWPAHRAAFTVRHGRIDGRRYRPRRNVRRRRRL